MSQVEMREAPWEMACSPGWLYMSATAQGTAIYRELRESERQATETASLKPMLLHDAASQEPMLGSRWKSILAFFAPEPDYGGANMKRCCRDRVWLPMGAWIRHQLRKMRSAKGRGDA